MAGNTSDEAFIESTTQPGDKDPRSHAGDPNRPKVSTGGPGVGSHSGEHSSDSDREDYGDLSDPDAQLGVYEREIQLFAAEGRSFKGQCPFHDDHHPSFRIDFKGGSWVWFCDPCGEGGNALGLLRRLGKLPNKNGKNGKNGRSPIAIYPYTDANGNLLFEVLRYGEGKGKTFKQRRPDGKGGWHWGVGEEIRTLYNLPAVTNDNEVVVVEGEKDVETARKLGIVATTNPMGSGKWLPKYSRLLAGKDVVLIPDNDQAGEKHLRLVFKSLCDVPEHPKSIKIVRLPKGKDLSEWVDAGGTTAQLHGLIGKADKVAYLDESTGKFVVGGDRERDGDSKVCYFSAAWGNGKPDSKGGESREAFEYQAGEAAIKEIRQYGELCRTPEGDLYFTSNNLPWNLVPLIDDDPRFIALIDQVFQIRSTSVAFKVILSSLQNEAFVNGRFIQVRQFCHADNLNKIVYVSLCDGKRMLKLTGTNEDTWDDLPIVPNGTDGIYFIDDPSWEPWQPVKQRGYIVDDETGEEFEIFDYDRTIAKRLLVDPIKLKDDILTADEQRWLMDRTLTSLLIDLPEKPLIALVGDNGSGKTFVGETIKTALLGSRAGRAENISSAESLRVSLTSSPLVIVDNLDDVDKKQLAWLVKDLSTACTGTTIPLRRLYTTNQKVTLEPRSWIIGTSTNHSFINNSSALADRVVVFTLDRVQSGGFKERQELMRPILKERNAIMTDLALRLNDYVNAWRASKLSSTDFRVAAFGLTISRMAEQDHELEKAKDIFGKIVAKQKSVLTENHWLIETIDRFIVGGEGVYTANGEVLLDAARDAGFHNLTVNKIHDEIEALNRILTERYDFKVTHPGNRKTYTFRRKAAGDKKEGGANQGAGSETA